MGRPIGILVWPDDDQLESIVESARPGDTIYLLPLIYELQRAVVVQPGVRFKVGRKVKNGYSWKHLEKLDL